MRGFYSLKYFKLAVVFSIITLKSGSAAEVLTSGASSGQLCPSIVIEGEVSPSFSDVEKRLVCGESDHQEGKIKGKSDTQRPWSEIPATQAKYFLKNFLQARGYHQPRFEQHGAKVRLWVGEQTFLRKITLRGDRNSIDIERRRNLMGQPLTPSLLDLLETWVKEQLEEVGYACPQVESTADPKTGEAILEIRSGVLSRFTSVEQEPVSGLHPDILRRYDAFFLGEVYDRRLLEISSNRIKMDGIAESTNFLTHCDGNKARLQQVVISGQPRLLSVGLGINTEGVVLGRATWKNTRLGRMGSALDASLYLSARLQNLGGKLNWFFFPYVSRTYLSPSLNLSRRDERNFEQVSVQGQIGLGHSLETSDLALQLFFGPSANFYQTLRGVGAPQSALVALSAGVTFRSHDFEYFSYPSVREGVSGNPRSGFQISAGADLTDRSLLSSITAQRFFARWQFLKNFRNYDPPLWIFGFRGGLATVVTPELVGPGTLLPASYLQYLGGSADLRGFARQELAGISGGGGLTSVFGSAEVRLSGSLPVGFEPLAFIDAGALGQTQFSLDGPLFWSPGLGFRWASPIGSVRATLAHGFAGTTPRHFQFYFSLGEEF